MRAKTILLGACLAYGLALLTGCTPAQDQAIKDNAARIKAFCDGVVIPTAAATPDTVAAAIPYGTMIKASSVALCKSADLGEASITTLPWLQENVTTLQTGKPATSPPIQPAPVTAH